MKSVCFLIFFLSLNLYAKKPVPPMKWGEVPAEDLAMTVYEADEAAEAVVLGDYGNIEFEIFSNRTVSNQHFHRRIKLLKKSAFDRGDISIFSSKKYGREVRGIKAQVILPDGTIIKVSKKDIFDEKVSEHWSVKKFAFPQLVEGCIIEYKYTLQTKDLFQLIDWRFQEDIPVRVSMLDVSIPHWYDYMTLKQGIIAREKLLGVVEESHYNYTVQVVRNRFWLENLPAIQEEPYMTTANDYYARIRLQLAGTRFNNNYKAVLATWKELAKELEHKPSFGRQYIVKKNYKKLLQAVEPGLKVLESESEKVQYLYEYLCNHVNWNETFRFRVRESLNKAFENKSASSGELNLMLVALLKHFGMTAYPVLVSTRNHGRIFTAYPFADQFNHALAMVQTGKDTLLFDVGSPLRSPDLLRMPSCNYKGWIVNPKSPEWIDLPAAQDKKLCHTNIEIHPDGSATGHISQAFSGYSAMENRRITQKGKTDPIREKWSADFPDITLSNIELNNQEDKFKPLHVQFDFALSNFTMVNGDFIYLSPVLNGMDENLLKLETRSFDVDIPCKIMEQYILDLTIPDGYTFEEIPESVNMTLPNGDGKFKFMVEVKDNQIQLISKLSVDKLKFKPSEYPALKGFFDRVVEKHSEQIVLKKLEK